jgi:coenzyme F420-0:L-glutamate ligase/coenzyme F420-1:gamma-L-glutamate ligase
VQVVLDETREVRRAEHGVLIALTHHGFVCANAGVDASNTAEQDSVILLPVDPDASARRLRAGLRAFVGCAPAVIVTDSFGRAWRHAQCDVAIGCAGLEPIDDWRGRTDIRGRELHATAIAIADELAAAADLARSKDGMQPAIVIDGAGRWVTTDDGPGIAPLLRGPETDLFR